MLFSFAIHASQCTNDVRVRKEVRDMSPEEWADYKQAVRAMQEDGSFNKQGAIHLSLFGKVHGGYNFGPWHRAFLCGYEDEVRKHAKNKQLTVPYYAAWEDAYTYGANSIDRSPIFSEKYFGAGDGKGCVKSSPDTIFQTNMSPNGGNHCVLRRYNHDQAISGRDAIEFLQKETTDFKDFSDVLQVGYHAETHLFVAGDMSQHWSANDPIFYSHHAAVDAIYDGYQENHKDFDPASIPGANDKIFGFEQYTYGDAHAGNICCVKYEQYSKKADGSAIVTNKPANATDLANLGIPQDKVEKQDDWNALKENLAKISGIPLISAMVNKENTGADKEKPTDSSSATLLGGFIGLCVLYFF